MGASRQKRFCNNLFSLLAEPSFSSQSQHAKSQSQHNFVYGSNHGEYDFTQEDARSTPSFIIKDGPPAPAPKKRTRQGREDQLSQKLVVVEKRADDASSVSGG